MANSLTDQTRDFQRGRIVAALRKAKSMNGAARILATDVRNLRRKCRDLDINIDAERKGGAS